VIDTLKGLFRKITGRGRNNFVGTWEAVGQKEGERKCVFVLDDTTWTVYYDGQKIKPPPGTYDRTGDTTADIYYSADFYVNGVFFAIATFTLRDGDNTLVWTWGGGVEMEFARVGERLRAVSGTSPWSSLAMVPDTFLTSSVRIARSRSASWT
jgi:hypothetical protein